MERKKVCIRIGDIFCAEIGNSYKKYFQYVAIDETQLYSRVIRVFKKRYELNAKFKSEDIVNDEVEFYAHTFIRDGIKEDLWYKCGNSKNIGDVTNINFRLCAEGNLSHLTVSHNWYVWKINDNFKDIGDMSSKYINYDLGAVYAAIHVYNKIKTGKFGIKQEEIL